jgi:tetratricopeptide (TPR) repeat protein
MKTFIKISLIILFIFPFSQSFAGTDQADNQFGFAEHYFLKHEYFRAVGEYERFIYLFPEDDRVESAMYQIGLSYVESKRFQDAIGAFTELIEKFQVSGFGFQLSNLVTQAYFMISECHMKLNAPGAALANLNNLISMTNNQDVRDEASYRIGWIYLETASWENADASFGKISEKNKNKYQLKRLSAELEGKDSIPRKSPMLAGGLSAVIPGAGYFYCGRYYDGLTAFFVNAALMCAAYESFSNGNEALGGIITLVETGFYTGTIYGSVSSAHKHNQRNTINFIEKLKQNTKIGLSGYKDGVMISFQYAF